VSECVTERAGLRAALAMPQRVYRECLGGLLSNTDSDSGTHRALRLSVARLVNISLAERFRACLE